LRLPKAWVDTLLTAAAGFVETREAWQRRLAEPPPRVPSEQELFEPERDTCPWCTSASLRPRVDTTDLFQNKPGQFHLDECTSCGHIFQNPALTIAGLNYYYDEFYEGIGEEMWEGIFAAGVEHNRNRVAAIDRQTTPKAWLDVGCGHGHFCLTARQQWPDTRFDGVDMSETVQEAQRRGWIDIAHFGLFTELADDLPRIYDVVSMHHYLEHTRDPRPELAAAAKVLLPGGHLMIEVPDPATPWARRLGRFWFTWAQPQHLHFVKCEELTAELERMGFEVVSVERGAATLGLDLSGAVVFGVQSLAASPHLPWLRRPPLGSRLKRMAVVAAAAPVFVAAFLADAVKDARPTTRRIGNAYRVVARAPE
jgi:SAM-dependent methyltransferase